MDAQQQDRLARLAARGRVSSTTPSADAAAPAAVTPMAATPAGGLDDAQAARLARLAGKGRVSRTATPAAPAPAVAARAAVPLPPPDPRFIIESDPVTAVLPMAGRARLDPPPAKASKRVSARDIIGSMPAGIEPRQRKGRRKHAAIAGRIVVVGMTTSAFLGGLAALASAPPPAWEQNNAKTAEAASETESTDADAAATDDATMTDETATDETVADAASTTAPPPVQDTIYVIQKVPRVIYVDENGNPLDPNAAPAAAEEPAAGGGAPAAPAAKPKAKTPSGGGGGGGGAPAAAADPAPAAAAPAAAPAAAAPAAPAAPAATAAPKPKPTTPPTTACTGSKC